MLRRETLYSSPTKRIKMSVWKSKKQLVMHLQEFDVDPNDPQWESFMVFQSWGPTVAREHCTRATDKAIERFYQAHIAEARALVAARVAVLEAA